MARHGLTDEQWALIEDLFPEPAATGRPPRDPRELFEGILWVLRTGSPWRDVPEEFGPWKTVDNHYDLWNGNGTLDQIRGRLRGSFIEEGRIDSELWCIDGSIVRAARCAGGGGKKGIPTNRKTTL